MNQGNKKEGEVFNLENDLEESHDLSGNFPKVKAQPIDEMEAFLGDSEPSCGAIFSQNTRKHGDKDMYEALDRVCTRLLSMDENLTESCKT